MSSVARQDEGHSELGTAQEAVVLMLVPSVSNAWVVTNMHVQSTGHPNLPFFYISNVNILPCFPAVKSLFLSPPTCNGSSCSAFTKTNVPIARMEALAQ